MPGTNLNTLYKFSFEWPIHTMRNQLYTHCGNGLGTQHILVIEK